MTSVSNPVALALSAALPLVALLALSPTVGRAADEEPTGEGLLVQSAGSPPEEAAPPGTAAPEGSAEPAREEDPFSLPVQPSEAAPQAPASERPGEQPPTETPAAETPAEPEVRVLISEVVIEGLETHPERERLERAAYDAMTVTPGQEVTRSELQRDLSAIFASGWFADVRIQPVDGPLGVRLVVSVEPNPVLTGISLDPPAAKIPSTVVQDTFAADLGKTLNLGTLQTRMQALQNWYADQGYSLARVTGPSRISPEGEVQLVVREGNVAGVEVLFLNKEGETTNDKGEPIKGKSKPWVVTREISMKPGDLFNRRNLEEDIKRLYGTGLFSDVKVTLRPVAGNPGEVDIVLGMVEQSTGSLSGGLGYSQSQGVFGQVQLQDSNFRGRAWDVSTSFTYGQFGALADLSFTDPWIKGDPFRTAFRGRLFVSRDVPQIFQSQSSGNILTVSESYKAPGTRLSYNINRDDNPLEDDFRSVAAARAAARDEGKKLSWFDLDGNTVVVQRIGGSVQFVRPLNGGNPFISAPWSLLVGLNAQEARPMNFGGDSMRFGVSTNSLRSNDEKARRNGIICLAYNCASENQLVGLRFAATMNTLDDTRNPTRGNFLSLGTEQFITVGPDSPTFNRLRGSFTHFIPVNWLRIYKGCRPKPGETEDCKQALAFQVTAGTNIGEIPPYEAFCIGGGNSVRGYFDCDLGVARTYGEATIEYRFPLFSIISGEFFVDGGTAFGTQRDVPGRPGVLLRKPGNGFSVGTGLIVTTPVGPLRLEVASQDFTGEWRFNLGVGWKF